MRYHVGNIALKEIIPAFINDFELYLRTENHCSHNTVWVVPYAASQDDNHHHRKRLASAPPFIKHEIRMEETERAFLTNEELKRLMDMRFKKQYFDRVDLSIWHRYSLK